MKRVLGQRGELNVLVIPVILLALLFIGAASFAFWAFNGRQDYKNNSDQKVQAAVQANTTATQSADASKYAEEAKQPYKTYTGPSPYGTLQISYPKTWSAYVDTTTSSSTPIDGYLYPDVVPSITDQGSSFALRVQVVTTSYDQVMQQFQGLLQQKKVSIAPFALAKVPSVIGSRIDGQIAQNKQGSMIVLPLRDKTLKVWTESSNFANDFNNIILPNITFSP